MRGMRIIPYFALVFMSIGLIALLAGGHVDAQGENLITNSSFEGLYESYVPETGQELADCPLGICTTAQMPWGWKPWWVKERPTDVNPEFKPAEAGASGNRVNSGQRASQYFSFWSTHKAGLRQTVTVPAFSTVEFSILGQAWMTESDTSLVSDRSGSANMRVGIDPTGETNPYGASIIWSEYQHPFDAYQRFAVRAQAQGDTVTVFTFSAPSVNPNSPEYGFKHTDMYWDDASLVVVGAGSAPPASQPTTGGDSGGTTGTTTTAPYIPAPTSTPNAEGVILTEVRSGDSLWAISARAGLSINDFVELNGITRDHIIRSGDFLITGHGDPPGEEEATGGEETDAGSEEQATDAEPEPLPTQPPIPTETGPTLAEQEISGGTICLSAFDDADQDTVNDENEVLRAAVAITISDGEQVTSNYITDGQSEPFCIKGLTGTFRVTRSSLPNETLTTPGDYAVAVAEDTAVNIEFGSFLSDNVLVSSDSSDSASAQDDGDSAGDGAIVEESDDPLSNLMIVGIVAAVLLLAGIVILILSRRRASPEV